MKKTLTRRQLVLRILGAILGFILVALAVLYVTGGLKRMTASFRGETEKIERTEGDGRFRQATYEEFFDLCAAVQDAEARITALEAELEGGPSAFREEQIKTSITAVLSSRAESVNEYNSKAGQEHRSAFRDNDLPHRLDLDNKETQCAL